MWGPPVACFCTLPPIVAHSELANRDAVHHHTAAAPAMGPHPPSPSPPKRPRGLWKGRRAPVSQSGRRSHDACSDGGCSASTSTADSLDTAYDEDADDDRASDSSAKRRRLSGALSDSDTLCHRSPSSRALTPDLPYHASCFPSQSSKYPPYPLFSIFPPTMHVVHDKFASINLSSKSKGKQPTTSDIEDWENLKELFARASEAYDGEHCSVFRLCVCAPCKTGCVGSLECVDLCRLCLHAVSGRRHSRVTAVSSSQAVSPSLRQPRQARTRTFIAHRKSMSPLRSLTRVEAASVDGAVIPLATFPSRLRLSRMVFCDACATTKLQASRNDDGRTEAQFAPGGLRTARKAGAGGGRSAPSNSHAGAVRARGGRPSRVQSRPDAIWICQDTGLDKCPLRHQLLPFRPPLSSSRRRTSPEAFGALSKPRRAMAGSVRRRQQRRGWRPAHCPRYRASI